MNDPFTPTTRYLQRIMGMALVLFVVMVLIRGLILGFFWAWPEREFLALSQATLGSFYDSLYVLGLVVVFGLLISLARRRPALQRGLFVLFILAMLISFFAAVVNIRFIQYFGRPFNYQWLYYSDFLQSVDSHQAMTAEVTWFSISLFALAFAVMFWLSTRVVRVIQWAFRPQGRSRVAWATAVMIPSLYLVGGGWWVNHAVARSYCHPAKFDNAVLSFVASFWQERQRPGLFTMKTTVSVDELHPAGDRHAESAPLPWGANDGISNVIVFVLESVPAQYTDPFGGKYHVTPTMNRCRNRAALFPRFYALAPNTLKTLFSIQTSVYPWVSYRFITAEHPDIAVPTLTSELKRYGYRTGFFNSADNRFQSMGLFMSNHGVDHVEDWRDRECRQPKMVGSTESWPFLDGNDDKCTVNHLVRWIDEKPDHPFCAILWTLMTHYPYFAVGPEQDYGVGDKQFNRYLNGLRYGDEALGLLLDQLEKRGLTDSTLVVVMGDHGEGFMQHGMRLHSSGLYDEMLRVPMMMINPRLFSGQEYPVLAGTVDLPPTILHILNHPLPGEWQGRSVFSTNRSERIYFFAAWSDYWFGYREGDQAFFYNASQNRSEAYDMAKDPLQKTNLVEQTASTASTRIERIAAWIQYQNAYIDKLVKAASR